ncbi:MAG TPA: flagellin lysine-N-methylase [Mobilitalea sp.]|nr:flagellin lysine-N-methylase [Mobilitalea sp.]
MNIVKAEFYDDFRCIAGQCSFTCCKGWDIVVDKDTLEKWSNDEQSDYFGKNVKSKKHGKVTDTYIKVGPRKCCPFFNDKGLCNIVINHGEYYLTQTCRLFPRQENCFGEKKEYSLSCACPAVVDIISDIKAMMRFVHDGDESSPEQMPKEYWIRKSMIAIMQNRDLSVTDRLLLIFRMLLSVKLKPDSYKEIVSRYEDGTYLSSIVDIWKDAEMERSDSLLETNELFLDIVQNYRNEKQYSGYLEELYELAEELDTDDALTEWDDFKRVFGQYDKVMENCIVSKIFADCVNDDLNEMIISYQMIITEYTMVRHSAFLTWLYSNAKSKGLPDVKSVDYSIIRDYIVIYSRIIGYNADGMKEFRKDCFDEAVWEFGYMLLLIS